LQGEAAGSSMGILGQAAALPVGRTWPPQEGGQEEEEDKEKEEKE